MSSTSDSVSLLSSSSGSMQSRGSAGRRLEEESASPMAVVGRIPMDTITEVREDPPEEIAESSWPAKAGYDWVVANVRNQSSLFWWFRLLNSWLNCTLVIANGVDRGIVSLEGVSVVERVCHGSCRQVFLYVYVSFFPIAC